ncbi:MULTISPECIES: polyprenyl synthetase family protein [Bacillus]|uniref:polyprenyl synthetase family protein n=1 Tax=Bacillus TaxID=1386 RepID=UPI00031BB907|nr:MULTISPECIES: farnesyl diphosphate synthase [Bacillus]
MPSLSFDSFMKEHKEIVEAELTRQVDLLAAPAVLKDSMVYSLQAGGKRIRPLLVFAVLDAFGSPTSRGLAAACGIEMIHTYSLIHDDLPSMDDDDIRRGKPTNHKVYGEANAILAGDALLTLCFQILANMNVEELSANQLVEVIKVISTCAGAEGMVGGQTADMEAEGKSISLSELEYIHEHKTGKLLTASVLTGAILAGATEEQKNILSKFSYHLGLAFQIRDDILDIEGVEEEIGKPVGSDLENDKNTYPALLTLEGAKERLNEEINLAKEYLQSLQLNDEHLMNITKLIAVRNK